MKTIIYWFRNDLRLLDNPGFAQACCDAEYLLPVVIHDPQSVGLTEWGFERVGRHRQKFLNESIGDLKRQLQQAKTDLRELHGKPADIFLKLAKRLGDIVVYCQQIEAPEEKSQLEAIRSSGIAVREFWQSSMLDPADLPFELDGMPDVFTAFRQRIEAAKLKYAMPIAAPKQVPHLPSGMCDVALSGPERLNKVALAFEGGESKAHRHIDQYFERRLPDTYKQTRNQLMGKDYSSKFSPWLALGCCSARSIAHRLEAYEQQHGANDGTYWLWFELLWRDYFEFLPFKYGARLFHAQGLSDKPISPTNLRLFNQWIAGQTPDAFINAGMTELFETGFLSNRMRQIVASYWIYDMGGDWRAGAAWFESQLIDYDVYSNQGNWLYIAGRGTDPRGGRPFNVAKQAREHDPNEAYRRRWLDERNSLGT